MAREILLQPRQISISTTLLAKVQTIAIGTADTDAKQDEMFLHKSGHAFVADVTGTKLVGTGTGTVDSKLVPIVTPIDILPRFAVPGTLGDGSEVSKTNPINVQYFFTFEHPPTGIMFKFKEDR